MVILSIMPFAEGELPVKYLEVPFISSGLLNRDCKILVEKAKNRIGDWKNKSLYFAGRLQLSWDAIRPRGNKVEWFRIVWFSHNIPRHAFHLWLVMRNGLKIYDKMRLWDVCGNTDLNLLRCALCDNLPDSHSHLFFECTFSAKDILLYLQPMGNKRTSISVFGKLILDASAYFIWMERNNRTFKNTKRSSGDVRDIIMVTVWLKLFSLRFKNTAMVRHLLER
ncbi:homeodomain-like protein [Tanacetum coccineum]